MFDCLFCRSAKFNCCIEHLKITFFSYMEQLLLNIRLHYIELPQIEHV